jgi:hypothetical protein
MAAWSGAPARIGDLSLVEKAAEWASLRSLVRIEAERFHKATGQTERETQYYITSPCRRKPSGSTAPSVSQDKTANSASKANALNAAWDNDYLLHLLAI